MAGETLAQGKNAHEARALKSTRAKCWKLIETAYEIEALTTAARAMIGQHDSINTDESLQAVLRLMCMAGDRTKMVASRLHDLEVSNG